MNESIPEERTASEPQDRVAELVEQQTAISEVLRAIASSPHDLQPIFDAILDSATRLCRADLGSLRLSEEGGLRRVSVRGDPHLVSQAWSSYPVLEKKESFLSRLAPGGLPTHMPDLRELEGARRDEFLITKVNAGLRTGLVVRLLHEDETVGTISIGRKKMQPFTDKEISLFGDFAAQAAIALESTRRERQHREMLQKIIETVPAFLWSTGPDGEPTHINQRVLDYSGMRLEDFRRGGWEVFLHPDDFAETAKAFGHAIQTGTSYEAVHRLRRADGEYRWYRARGEPLRDGQGNIIQWYGLSVDIDERKKAEDRLRRSEAHLSEAQRLSHSGASVYNETTILYWSEETYRIWGFDPAQGIPSREAVFQRIHTDDRDRVRAESQRASHEKRGYSIAYRIELPDGTIKYVDSISQPVFSASGELVEVVATQVDVTERKRAQEEHERLRQLESDLARMHRLSTMGELAASLAHEIAQPIATARNNAQAALNFSDRGAAELSQVREALNAVVDDADRAGEILDRIRDHIRKAPPRKERVHLNKAITDVIALAQGAIVRNGVSVQTRLAEALPVQADRVQVQQVVLNLILNAVEAMSLVDAGGRALTVITEQQKTGGVLVAVRDTGPGIDPEHLNRVFDAFYTTKSSGVGMGLSICRSIIHAHGGRLWADVNTPHGAIFQFTLPTAESC